MRVELSRRCRGSDHYAGLPDRSDGLDRVFCPYCGKSVVANRTTGLLARHNASDHA